MRRAIGSIKQKLRIIGRGDDGNGTDVDDNDDDDGDEMGLGAIT